VGGGIAAALWDFVVFEDDRDGGGADLVFYRVFWVLRHLDENRDDHADYFCGRMYWFCTMGFTVVLVALGCMSGFCRLSTKTSGSFCITWPGYLA